MSRATSPSSGWRSTSSSPRRRRCSAPARCRFGEEPNTRTCPVCLGLPGALPVLNARAVHYGLVMGLALRLRDRAAVDLPPQELLLSRQPEGATRSPSTTSRCACGGQVGDVRLHRIHLEEDAAKLIHLGESGRIHGSSASVVDFNRGGTPLAEIVTEPDLHSAEQAREWLTLLRVTLRQLGVSDVNMEEGSLRCDANVSIRPAGSEELGTKTELKNMNSFRFVMQGINAEIERQTALLEAGEPRRARRRCTSTPASGRLTPAALQGGGARLPLLPRARPRAAGADRGDDPGRARRAARAARRARRALRARLGAAGGHRAAVRVPARARRLLRGGRHGGRGSTRPVATWVKDELARRLAPRPIRPPRTSRRRRWPSSPGSSQAGTVTRGAARQVLDRLVERRRRPGRDRRAARAWARWATATSSRRSSRA